MSIIIQKILNVKQKLKRKYYTHIALKGITSYKGLPFINNKSQFNKKTAIGKNCHFNGMDISGGGTVIIGDNFHSGASCMMITQNHNIHGDALPYDNTYIYKDIIVADNVWLGSRVIVLGGVTIGEGAVIQAGSVVVSDIPPLAIAGGHPAKAFNSRDSEHYYKLKKLNRFH